MDRIGPYRIIRQIGQGGMGVVYAAHDDRLDRAVAVKLIKPEALANETARERFRREARAAARVTHPNICILYEFNEDAGRPYLVMELLEGEPLSARIARGPLPIAEMMPIASAMLGALSALHQRGIMHRDLKPANVFLTPHGPKLLDFGLAQPPPSAVVTGELPLTTQGMMVGTPQYMAPEQVFGQPIDERADIFAAGTVIYEMLSGRPAFAGDSIAAVIHAVGYTEPAGLSLGRDAGVIESVIRRTLAKNPAQRPGRADELAKDLQAAIVSSATTSEHRLTRQTRFVALPLRVLRPDPDTDFLAFSVPDAVSSALAALESMIVRSPQAAAALGHDVRAIARELAVDVVLTGSLLRAGSDVRVSAQLADAEGTMLWSDVAQAPIADLFQLQDVLTARIVSALQLPLTKRERRALEAQEPGSAEAYELFMRANQLMTESSQWETARNLYERAVAIDPEYAPAWARLGRARRLLAKWGGPAGIGLLPQAEAAFKRALEIDPDLPIAHDLSVYVDAELGRAPEAMQRLLERAATRPNDAGVLAGLVTTCRYAGLLDEAIAADACAKAIDPAQPTSVAWSYFFKGDREMAKRTDTLPPHFCANLSKFLDGEISVQALAEAEAATGSVGMRLAMRAYRLIASRQNDEALEILESLRTAGFSDPEGWYLYAYMLARSEMREPALVLLARSVAGGFGSYIPLTKDPAWLAFRGEPQFEQLVSKTEALVSDARRRFNAANGTHILKLRSDAPQSR